MGRARHECDGFLRALLRAAETSSLGYELAGAATIGIIYDETDGLNYWLDQLAHGSPLSRLVADFAGSPEYGARFTW